MSLKSLVAALALIGSAAFAQDPTPSPTDLSPDEMRQSVFDDIIATRADITAQIEAVIAKLPEITTSIEGANEAFDEIVATLRTQAELGNPDGVFVQQIRRLAEQARSDAGAARVEGYSDLEQLFLADADKFESDGITATQIYESLDRRIRAIEAERTRIVFLIKLRRYEEAKAVVDAGLDVLRDADAKLGEIEASVSPEGIAN